MKYALIALLVTLSAACATFAPATKYGPDVLVVQYSTDGAPSHCWKLRSATVYVHPNGNVQWVDIATGNTISLTGRTNFVKVEFGNFAAAALNLGIDHALCDSGIYPAKTIASERPTSERPAAARDMRPLFPR